MVIVFEDFEDWNVNTWLELTGGNGFLNVPNAGCKLNGLYGMNSGYTGVPPSSYGRIKHTFSNPSNDILYSDFWFKIVSEGFSDTHATNLASWDAGGNSGAYLVLKQTSGVLHLRWENYAMAAPTGYDYTSFPLSVGVWYHIKAKWKVHTTDGVEFLWINDTVLRDFTGQTTDLGRGACTTSNYGTSSRASPCGAINLCHDDIWEDFSSFRCPIRNTHIIEIRGDEKRFVKLHYIKNHPSSYPDTFDMRMLAEDADDINYWDIIDIRKDGVSEFVGFVEEKTPIIGENGLEYFITGRCWKVVSWKKQTERFIETREVGPASEAGFFGKVYPRELLMFLLRTPISIHPAGKVRHKIGWGIHSDAWVASANRTNSGFYPAWAICRHIGFAWQNGTPAAPEQQLGDYFQIDLGQAYDRITAILIESRDDITETQYARNFEIQLSSDGVNWTTVRSFDGYGARDILASWAPVNNVRYVRIYITLTRTDNPNWEISQVYIWQTEDLKYRLLNEEETIL